MIVNNNNLRRRRTAFLSGGRGMGDLPSNVNATTMWTPTTGFLAKPGDISSGGGSGGPGIYVAPTLLGAPACASSPNANTADSQECQQQLIANNLHDIGQSALANYNVFLQDCLNTFPQPTDCYQRTFGLTPMGATGGTSVDNPNAQLYITGVAPKNNPPAPGSTPGSGICMQPDYYDKTGVCIDPFTLKPVPGVANQSPPPSKALPTSTNNQINNQPPSSQQNQMLFSDGGISTLTSDLGGDVSILGFQVPIWAIGIAAIGGLFLLSGHH